MATEPLPCACDTPPPRMSPQKFSGCFRRSQAATSWLTKKVWEKPLTARGKPRSVVAIKFTRSPGHHGSDGTGSLGNDLGTETHRVTQPDE
jgi:hypothetical protein